MAGERTLEFRGLEPCDAPLPPPDLHARPRAEIRNAHAAFAQTCEGVEPLCALWRSSALGTIEAALANEKHPPILSLLRDIGAAPVWFADPQVFVNADRPDDLKAVAD